MRVTLLLISSSWVVISGLRLGMKILGLFGQVMALNNKLSLLVFFTFFVSKDLKDAEIGVRTHKILECRPEKFKGS